MFNDQNHMDQVKSSWYQLFEGCITPSTVFITTIYWIARFALLTFIHWIAVYQVDSVIHLDLSNTTSQMGNLISFLISLRLLQQWTREGRQELTPGASEGREGLEGTR